MLKLIFSLIVIILLIAALCQLFPWCGKNCCKNRSAGSMKLSHATLDSLTNHGATDLDDVIINGPLTCNGAADLEKVEVKGALKVNGRLNAEHLNVQGEITVRGKADIENLSCAGDVTIHGKVDLEDATVAGTTTIHGKVDIDNCHLQDLVVAAEKLDIDGSTIKSIVMKKIDAHVIVYLDNTTVAGDIVFEDENGEVILEGRSSIGGKVIGGNVVSK